MLITKTSILSGRQTTIDIPILEEDYISWINGASIQDAAPYLSLDHREFMISGITQEEWDNTFPDEEE